MSYGLTLHQRVMAADKAIAELKAAYDPVDEEAAKMNQVARLQAGMEVALLGYARELFFGAIATRQAELKAEADSTDDPAKLLEIQFRLDELMRL